MAMQIFQGPCRGDSGSPLYVDHGKSNQMKLTIEGIVSGGVGKCGDNVARWYISVSAHREWINCIITGIKEKKTKIEIEQLCEEEVQDYPSKNLVFNSDYVPKCRTIKTLVRMTLFLALLSPLRNNTSMSNTKLLSATSFGRAIARRITSCQSFIIIMHD